MPVAEWQTYQFLSWIPSILIQSFEASAAFEYDLQESKNKVNY